MINENKLKTDIRIIYDGEVGTVKYIGEVPPTEGIWLGVEWDNPTRGKHNGCNNGVSYFSTSSPNAGSFIRPNKVDYGTSCYEAIVTRYQKKGDQNEDESALIVSGNRTIELVGMDAISMKQSHLDHLKVVCLDRMNVSNAGEIDELKRKAPNIEELDLSRNLLSSWEEVAKIVQQLKHLRILNLSGNRFCLPLDTNQLSASFSHVQTLLLVNVNYNWNQVSHCICMWPNIDELLLASNKITTITPLIEDQLQTLKYLDLSNNEISSWQDILNLGNLLQLKSLLLNNIGLTQIEFPDLETNAKTKFFPALCNLWLNDNNIQEWKSIDELNKLLNLTELNIKSNPVLNNETAETVRQLIIAKISKLQRLRGTKIEAEERRGAELDYIKRFGPLWLSCGGDLDLSKNKPSVEFLTSHPIYRHLLGKHGVPEISELETKPTNLKSSLLSVNIISPMHPDRLPIVKKLPSSMNLQKVKALVHKLFNPPIDILDLNMSYRSSKFLNCPEFKLDNDHRQLGFFAIENEDTIIVRW